MRNVLEYLEDTAIKYPENGIIENSGFCSYKELLLHSQTLATKLCSKISLRKPIPVFMDKGIDCLIAFLGILYSGCFYVLINPELPKVRIENIMKTLDSKFIITNAIYKERAVSFFPDVEIYQIEDFIHGDIDVSALLSIRNRLIDTDPMYAIFTSGSTGNPKGVLVSHRSVIDFINVFTDTFGFSNADRIANQAPFDFDVAIKDIFTAIKTGANLIIVPKNLFSAPAKLLDYLCEYKPTTMIWAVSALCLITTFHGLDYKVPNTINKILFSGEVMPQKHLKEWMDHLPEAMFVNLYGPTEITCNCTYHIVDKNRNYDIGLPIGKPFDNEEIILLDDKNVIIKEENKIAEICVRGSALALGYYNNKEETNKRFVQNPANDLYIDMIYRTGDLGYYLGEELYFAGRKDFQIKYLGHRIELEEIENTLCNIDGISRAICSFDFEKKKLYAFYIGSLDKKDLHLILSNTLPIYMIPSKLIRVSEFPLNKNGKIDRKELYKSIGGK